MFYFEARRVQILLCTCTSIYHGIVLSPDTERSPKPIIAYTGARYKISVIREIAAAGRRNSPCSSGGCSSGERPQSAPFSRRVRRALAPRRFAGYPWRSLFGGWALRTERVRGVASVGRAEPGEVLYIIFGSGGPESVYASQSAPSERMGSFGTEPQQAVVSWFS